MKDSLRQMNKRMKISNERIKIQQLKNDKKRIL